MIGAEEIRAMVENNRQEAIDCLVELVQTPSVTEDEAAVSKVFAGWMKKFGIQPAIVGIAPEHPNVLGEWFGSRPGKRFIFNGHMDTFPPVEGDPGMYGPFSGRVEDGYIYGRGTCDMKGGDAAVLMATGLLKRMGFDPRGSILLSYMCDEEIGGRYGVKWCVAQGLLEGDFGICPEPTRGKVLVGHAGILRMFVTYTAPAAHSGRHHPSMDALEKAITAINAFYRHRDNVIMKRTDPEYTAPSLCITTLHAGTATNVHATKATFSVDYRIVSAESHEQVQRELLGVLDGLKAANPFMDYSYEIISDRPVLAVREDSPIVLAALEAYKEITGNEGELYRRIGGSDAANIYAHNGIQMPNWGVANDLGGEDFGVTHPNERIPVEDYLQSIMYYMLTVVKLMSSED